MDIQYTFSTYPKFHEVLKNLEEFLNNYSSTLKNYVIISIVEAVNNVFEHTEKTNDSLVITLSIIIKKKQLILELTHNGVGFDFKSRLNMIGDPDQYFHQHITSIRGRGIAIMKKCADEIQYSDNGRNVLLIFQLK
ncbi:ATP-binding protein [Bacillus pinisoli]|uniref:ATP-binding protein n=1 Tax=Bacillus pinisoli TaxID=2901866 RepID=UPI001FF4FD42|nr:ATP-binding protein [Bacillus pinisoli]